MKNIFLVFAILISGLFLSSCKSSQAGQEAANLKNIQFQVNGNCGMCKTRIESALSVKGVKMADWNADSRVCKVLYNPGKIDETRLHSLVAEAGHDTGKNTATDKAYKNLHSCCKYRSAVKSCGE